MLRWEAFRAHTWPLLPNAHGFLTPCTRWREWWKLKDQWQMTTANSSRMKHGHFLKAYDKAALQAKRTFLLASIEADKSCPKEPYRVVNHLGYVYKASRIPQQWVSKPRSTHSGLQGSRYDAKQSWVDIWVSSPAPNTNTLLAPRQYRAWMRSAPG